MEDKRNTESVVQEIMEEVRMYGAAWFVSGQQQSISDKDALYFESKAQGHLLEIQSKLRKLVREQEEKIRVAVARCNLASDIIQLRTKERAHNLTNTTKE